MRYVRKTEEGRARRMVDFDSVSNIDSSGSVRGMQKLYGWPKGGQVRIGGYIYNIGTAAVERLANSNVLRS